MLMWKIKTEMIFYLVGNFATHYHLVPHFIVILSLWELKTSLENKTEKLCSNTPAPFDSFPQWFQALQIPWRTARLKGQRITHLFHPRETCPPEDHWEIVSYTKIYKINKSPSVQQILWNGKQFFKREEELRWWRGEGEKRKEKYTR